MRIFFFNIYVREEKIKPPEEKKKHDIMKDIFLYGRGREMAQWRDLGK